jgi:hypothetical protein
LLERSIPPSLPYSMVWVESGLSREQCNTFDGFVRAPTWLPTRLLRAGLSIPDLALFIDMRLVPERHS